MKLKIIGFTLLAVFLGSCSKTETLHAPINYPTSTRSGIKYMHHANDFRQIGWWKKLNDPELNQLISQSLARNDTIKSAYATIEQAQAQLKAAQYAWIPTLDAQANGFSGGGWNTHITPQNGLANNPFFSNRSSIRFRGYATGFVPGYTVNILNNTYNIKASKASLALSQAQAQATKLSIISQMSGTYFMLLSQREQLALEKSLSRDLMRLHQIERVRFQKGASDRDTLTNIEQQLAQEKAKIPPIEGVIAQSENTIHYLLNENPASLLTHRTLHSLNVNTLMPQFLPSSVLKNRPDIIIALNNVNRASAQIGVAYSAFFPTISLSGLLGKASVDLSDLLKLSTNIWIIEAAASMKIFNGQAYQNLKSAKAFFKTSYHDYLDTLHFAFAEVDDTLTNAEKSRLAYVQTQKAYLAAKKSHILALAQYKSGARDYRTVLNATINRARSQLSLVQEKAQLLDNLVQVYQAVAGGICTSPNTPLKIDRKNLLSIAAPVGRRKK